MSWTVITTFMASCVLLGLTPGPNMSLIVASTLAGGLRAGLITLAGTTTGLAILMTIAAAGMTSVMALMSQWFDWIRLAGALYLVLLGVRQVRVYLQRRAGALPPPAPSPRASYAQGLAVSLSNPKVLLFLGAFLPQFIDATRDPGPQLIVLAILFVAVLVVVDIIYTVAIARARTAIPPQRLAALDGAAGGLLMAGGVLLATVRRPV